MKIDQNMAYLSKNPSCSQISFIKKSKMAAAAILKIKNLHELNSEINIHLQIEGSTHIS
jgi:hypothetical protein